MSDADGATEAKLRPHAPTYLIAGATGVIGRRLVRALLDDGVHVRAVARDPARARMILGPDVELIEADFDANPDLSEAMSGVEVAYFLVHMLDSGPGYAAREREAAASFARAASAAGVERMIYLGGLGPDEGGSPTSTADTTPPRRSASSALLSRTFGLR